MTSLYHESIGTGETVVFLHSGFTDSRMWDSHWKDLAKDYRLVRYDRPGFGKTAPNGTAPNSRADLLNLLDTLGIEKAHFVGCSQGGEIIVDFALEHSERVLSLVVVSSLVSGFELKGEPPADLMALFGALQAGKLDEVSRLATKVFLAGEARKLEDIPQDLRDAVYEMSLKAAQNGALMQEEAEPLQAAAMQRLDEISVPTLLIMGQYENPTLLEGAQEISEKIPNARVLTIANAAHFPNMDAPEAFNQALREFLG